ncbi:MAG: sigma 54-interacting transcriptional regulator, partial [Candidatus Brocadiia bacterium]
MTSPVKPGETDPREDNVPLPAEEVRKLVENFERKRSQDGELEREISLLYAVLDSAKRLNDMLDLPLLLRYLLGKSLIVSRAERGFLYVLIPGVLDTTITLTDTGASWEMDSDGFSRSILATVLEKGRKLVFDGDDDSLHNRNSAFALGLSSAACFPLLRADEVIGAIYLHSRKDTKFGPAEIRTIGAFGDLAVAAISRALLLDEKEKARRRIEELNAELNRQLKDREEELSRTKEAFERQSSAFRPPENYGGMIGLSRAHRVCVDLLRSIEGSDIPVLISGESGTGKELAARAIHAYSGRAAGPFLPINCGAMPDSLLNAELFGYRKGAFTGASSD